MKHARQSVSLNNEELVDQQDFMIFLLILFAINDEATSKKNTARPDFMILSCPDVNLTYTNVLSSLTVCLNLFLCKLALPVASLQCFDT